MDELTAPEGSPKDISNKDIEISDPFGIAEAALMEQVGGMDAPEARAGLTAAEQAFLTGRRAMLQDAPGLAVTSLEDCIEMTRRPGCRNLLLEARARMHRGLARCSLGDADAVNDLKWAMERFRALSPTSREHGFAVLNLASHHAQSGEHMMALATLSEISRKGMFPNIIVGLSRRSAARSYAVIGDLSTAVRHHWVAWRLFCQEDTVALAESSALHCLDLMLADVSVDADSIERIIEDARPRPRDGIQIHASNPEDIAELVVWLSPRIVTDLGGESRPDLALLIEGCRATGIALPDEIAKQSDQIQDPQVVQLLDV